MPLQSVQWQHAHALLDLGCLAVLAILSPGERHFNLSQNQYAEPWSQATGWLAPIALGIMTPYPDGRSREQWEMVAGPGHLPAG